MTDYKILIVDDNKLNRNILVDLLEKDYVIDIAEDGEEAIRKIEENGEQYMAMLLDLYMPNVDGFEVLAKLNELELISSIPVLVISGENAMNREEQCFELGATDFIRKPFEPVIVKKRVENVINISCNQRYLREKIAEQTKILERQNELLNQRNVQLQHENDILNKTDYLSYINHDVIIPLNNIVGMTAIAEDNVDRPDKIKDALTKIDISSRQLLKIINELLDMRKLELGSIVKQNEQINISLLVLKVLTSMRGEFKAHSHKLKVEVARMEHELVKGDGRFITKILENIITNAVTYTPDGGEISILMTEKKAHIDGKAQFLFEISDNGIGISEEFLKNIFEPFTKPQDVTINKLQGIGLGLPIAKSLCELMDGGIKIESIPGEGTKVLISVLFDIQNVENDLSGLKCLKTATQNEDFINGYQEQVDMLKGIVYGGMRALVAEDQDFNREIIIEFLELFGMTADIAQDGEQAVELVEQSEEGYYDIMFMDITLPIIDGYEAARRIRALDRDDAMDLPIIGLTSSSFEEELKNCLEAGMNEHLPKPIEMQKMRLVLDHWL